MAQVGTGARLLPRLSWGPVIAGVLLALAAHVVLGLIGAAIGFAARPADSTGLGAGAGIWALLTPFVATLLGAWLACRMADARDTATGNLHGVMVWCVGLLAGTLFLAGTMASGAMTAGTAASGNAGPLQRITGASRADTTGPQAQARMDDAAKAAAAAAGGGAMAAIAGLLGGFAGAALARRREGAGLGFRIAIHRERRTSAGMATADRGTARAHDVPPGFPPYRAPLPDERSGEVARTERAEGPGAPPTDLQH